MSDIDGESRDFVYNWVQNNVSHAGPWWKSDVHDLSSVENRMLQLEADKDSLQLQVTILEDQLDSQTNRSAELERNLRDKQADCKRLEEGLGMERNKRTVAEKRTEELRTEAGSLKLKLARLERDMNELRNATPKLQRPNNLGGGLPRSPTPVSSPEDVSPTSRKGVNFSEENDPSLEMDTSLVSLSGRSTRGLRKIFGKIRRSNSGGFESERTSGGGAS